MADGFGSWPNLTRDQLVNRLRDLGFEISSDGKKICLGSDRYGSAIQFYREYQEWAARGSEPLLTYDKFVASMVREGYVIADSTRTGGDIFDHFLVMPVRQEKS